MNEKIKENIKKYREYAKKNGFKLNSNKKIVEGVVKGIIKNEEKFGKKYCPCRRVQEIPEQDKKIICPCIYHKEEIKKQGYCHCFLFVR